MYLQHFGLGHEPFSIAPDPRYLYLGQRHREALAHLLYGLDGGGGFVLLTGEVGAGKTTVCRGFLEQVPPHCHVAYVFNPKLTVTELLEVVCEEFGIAGPGAVPGQAAPTVKQYVDSLNRFLLASHAAGRNAVLVIDEAQQLAPDVLEQLRLLTNLETNERKLLQIVLVGQPELRELLAQPGLEQLAQRVIARYHLGPLDQADTGHYVQHRLAVAGLRGPSPIPPALMPRLHRLSGGVPRRINLLCDRALLGAYSQGRDTVDRRTLDRAAREVFWSPPDRAGGRSVPGGRWGVAAVAAALLVGVVVWRAWWPRPVDAAMTGAPVAARTGSAAASTVAALPLRAPSAPDVLPAAASAPPAPSQAGAASRPSPVSASAPMPAPAPGTTPVRAAVPLVDGPQLPTVLSDWRLSEDGAWRQLAALWGERLGPGEACTAAARTRLECYRTRSGLMRLRSVDRPSVLVLRDGAGPPTFVLLVGLGERQAWLQSGEQRFAVALSDLAAWWQGEFWTLWRSTRNGAVVPGARPAYDEELARLLTLVDGSLPLATTADELRARLSRFQMSRGLMPDGSSGPLTRMALNRAAGVTEPRLAVAP